MWLKRLTLLAIGLISVASAAPRNVRYAHEDSFALRAVNTILTVFRGSEGRQRLMVDIFTSCMTQMRVNGRLELKTNVSSFWAVGRLFSSGFKPDTCDKVVSKILEATTKKGGSAQELMDDINKFITMFNQLYPPQILRVKGQPPQIKANDASHEFVDMARKAAVAIGPRATYKTEQEVSKLLIIPATRKVLTDAASLALRTGPQELERRSGLDLPSFGTATISGIPSTVRALLGAEKSTKVRTPTFEFEDGEGRRLTGSFEDCINRTRTFKARGACFTHVATAIDEPAMEWVIDQLPQAKGRVETARVALRGCKQEIYTRATTANGGAEGERFKSLLACAAGKMSEKEVGKVAGGALKNAPEDVVRAADAATAAIAADVRDASKGALDAHVKGGSVMELAKSLGAQGKSVAADATGKAIAAPRTQRALGDLAATIPVGPGGERYDAQAVANAIAALTGLPPRGPGAPPPVTFKVSGAKSPLTLVQCLARAEKGSAKIDGCFGSFMTALPEPALRWALSNYPESGGTLSKMIRESVQAGYEQAYQGPRAKQGSELDRLRSFVSAAQHRFIDQGAQIAIEKSRGEKESPESSDFQHRSEAIRKLASNLKTTLDETEKKVHAQYLSEARTLSDAAEVITARQVEITNSFLSTAGLSLLEDRSNSDAIGQYVSSKSLGPRGERLDAASVAQRGRELMGVEPQSTIQSRRTFAFHQHKDAPVGTLVDCLRWIQSQPKSGQAIDCFTQARASLGEAAFEGALRDFPKLEGSLSVVSDAIQLAVKGVYDNPQSKELTARDRLDKVLLDIQLRTLDAAVAKAKDTFKPKDGDNRDWETTPRRRQDRLDDLHEALKQAIPRATEEVASEYFPYQDVTRVAEVAVSRGEAAGIEVVKKIKADTWVRSASARVVASLALGPDAEEPLLKALAEAQNPGASPSTSNAFYRKLASRLIKTEDDLTPESFRKYAQGLETDLLPGAMASMSEALISEVDAQVQCVPGRPMNPISAFGKCACVTKGGQLNFETDPSKPRKLIMSDDMAFAIKLLRMAAAAGPECKKATSELIRQMPGIMRDSGKGDGPKFFEAPLAFVGQAMLKAQEGATPVSHCLAAGAVSTFAGPALSKTSGTEVQLPAIEAALQPQAILETLADDSVPNRLRGTVNKLVSRLAGVFNTPAKRTTGRPGDQIRLIVRTEIGNAVDAAIHTPRFYRAIASDISGASKNIDSLARSGFSADYTVSQAQMNALLGDAQKAAKVDAAVQPLLKFPTDVARAYSDAYLSISSVPPSEKDYGECIDPNAPKPVVKRPDFTRAGQNGGPACPSIPGSGDSNREFDALMRIAEDAKTAKRLGERRFNVKNYHLAKFAERVYERGESAYVKAVVDYRETVKGLVTPAQSPYIPPHLRMIPTGY